MYLWWTFSRTLLCTLRVLIVFNISEHVTLNVKGKRGGSWVEYLYVIFQGILYTFVLTQGLWRLCKVSIRCEASSEWSEENSIIDFPLWPTPTSRRLVAPRFNCGRENGRPMKNYRPVTWMTTTQRANDSIIKSVLHCGTRKKGVLWSWHVWKRNDSKSSARINLYMGSDLSSWPEANNTSVLRPAGGELRQTALYSNARFFFVVVWVLGS